MCYFGSHWQSKYSDVQVWGCVGVFIKLMLAKLASFCLHLCKIRDTLFKKWLASGKFIMCPLVCSLEVVKNERALIWNPTRWFQSTWLLPSMRRGGGEKIWLKNPPTPFAPNFPSSSSSSSSTSLILFPVQTLTLFYLPLSSSTSSLFGFFSFGLNLPSSSWINLHFHSLISPPFSPAINFPSPLPSTLSSSSSSQVLALFHSVHCQSTHGEKSPQCKRQKRKQRRLWLLNDVATSERRNLRVNKQTETWWKVWKGRTHQGVKETKWNESSLSVSLPLNEARHIGLFWQWSYPFGHF